MESTFLRQMYCKRHHLFSNLDTKMSRKIAKLECTYRGVGSYRKLGGQVLICMGAQAGWACTNMYGGGHNLPPLVDIGFNNLTKPGWQLPTHLLRP